MECRNYSSIRFELRARTHTYGLTIDFLFLTSVVSFLKVSLMTNNPKIFIKCQNIISDKRKQKKFPLFFLIHLPGIAVQNYKNRSYKYKFRHTACYYY